MTSAEMKGSFATPGHQRVLKLRGDAQQIFVNGEFSGGSSGFWDYTMYVNPYMVVRPEGHYTKHIYVNSERIASKIGNPEDFGAGDPTSQGDAVGRKVKMEEVVEENYNELFGSVPEIEPAAEEQLGMSSGSTEPELNSYWFTSDHLVSLSLDKYGKVAVDFCSNQGARKEHSPSYATEEQRRVEQKDQDLVRLDLVIMTLSSSAFITDGSGVAIQHIEYMAFGEVFVDQRRTGFGTPYKFNGKELDCESGYYYYGARYYAPQFGRFLTVDPLAGDMPAWGSYTYTFDNPLTVIDPDGRSGESIHKDANGNIIAEIDDGDNNVYIHNDIQAGQHIDGKISRLKQKREEYGFGGGGEVDLLASVKNKISKFFEEGDQQQHSGENWFIYGKGAANGWSISAPKPDPHGANRSIDISDILPDGGGLGPNINPILGLLGFSERVNSTVDRLNNTGFGPKKVCTVCGDTLNIDAPKSYHTGFDTIEVKKP